MSYSPEPTHPIRINPAEPDIGIDGPILIDQPHSAQLGREFRAIEAQFAVLADIVSRALPWKAFMLILDGVGGATGGGANATLPAIADQYNIDTSVNAGAGLFRTSEGVYVFTLLVEVIGGEDVLEFFYPNFELLVSPFPDNLDITAESVRVAITDADIASGTLEISVEQLEVPPSGKGTWTPYDLRADDRLWSTGLLNLGGEAAAFGGAP